ncbi:MAG: hypothetical protein P4L69_14015 [Desulfosporosinus sp.]|nr:hypothetical protein [Desulfosporosinus sp.]
MRNVVKAKIKSCIIEYKSIDNQILNLRMDDPDERSEGIKKHIQHLYDKRREVRKEQIKYEKQLNVLDGEDTDDDF